MGVITEQQHKEIVNHQAEKYHQQASLQQRKIEQLVEKVSIEFASRLSKIECMYTRDCFQVYLKALSDTIANSDQDNAYLLPVVQKIKYRVFGC